MKRKLALSLVAVMLCMFAFSGSVWAAYSYTASLTRTEAIANYNKNLTNYQQNDLVKIGQYRTKYAYMNNSLADKVIERAIWYMNNGYSVYGHGYHSYQDHGVLDCSTLTQIVYGDFGFNITNASRYYGSVGTKVQGVYATKVNGYWKLMGTQNLRPGDILTWYATDANGKKYISHVGIYIGVLDNGQPAVINTAAGNPTAIGVSNDFRWWYGSNFESAQRVLPAGSWTPGKAIYGHAQKAPIIPSSYILPPQKKIVMP